MKKLPGYEDLRLGYVRARMLATIVSERWIVNPKKNADRSHLIAEWDFESPIEKQRHARILSALKEKIGGEHWGDALEVGCAEGSFTKELAKRCHSVTAWDLSPVACSRAKKRLAPCKNVFVEERDIAHDHIEAKFDLLFAMEVLSYFHGWNQIQKIVNKLCGALRPGGFLLVDEVKLPAEFEGTWWSRWFGEGGTRKIAYISQIPGMNLIHQEIYDAPTYQTIIVVFEKRNAQAVTGGTPFSQ